MIRTRILALGVLCCVVLAGAAHAGPAKKMRKLIEQGDHDKAIEIGRKYVASDKEHLDDEEVYLLVQQAHYLRATEANTDAAYAGFLDLVPFSPFHERVLEQHAQVYYEEKVLPYDRVGDYQAFRRRFPDSSLFAESLVREEEISWQEARSYDSVKGYQRFLEDYPDGCYAAAAHEREADLAYRTVRKVDDLDTYMRFLRSYPGSRFADEARQRSESLAWKRTQDTDTVEAYRDFRTAFLTGARSERAYTREIGLSWKNTIGEHQIPVYRTFEMDYPENDLALVAEKREWDLYHYERDRYPGELQTRISRAFRLPDGAYRLYLDVHDDSGQLVGGLMEQHFSVYDAGFEADIVELAGMEQNRPVDVVFVVDTSGSMSDEIEAVKDGIIRFAEIQKLRSRDLRLGLVTFIEQVFSINGGAPRVTNALTASPQTFQRWVEKIGIGQGSEEDHLMALELASRLEMREDAQRLVVVISDEDPTLRRRFRDPAALAETVASRDVSVYCVTPVSNAVKTITNGPGGALFPMTGRFARIMEAISQKTSKQYRLVYRRPPEAPPVIDQLKVKIRARSDYAWLDSGAGAEGDSGAGLLVVSGHDESKLFMALTSGGLMCSADGGATWLVCGAGLPEEPVVQLIVEPTDGATVWARTADGRLWISEDGGATFVEAGPEGNAVVALAADPDVSGAWLACDGRRLWRRIGTNAWKPLSQWELESDILLMSAHPSATKLLLLLTGDGGLWRSSDGGKTCVRVATTPWTTPPSGLAFHPYRRGLVFAYGPFGLYRSLDNGETWRAIDLCGAVGLDGVQTVDVYSVLFDPSVRHLILLMTSAGVLASDDMGRGWFSQNTGLDSSAFASLRCGAVRSDGRVLLASQAGQGLVGMERIANREYVFSNVFFASGSAAPNKALWPHLDDLAQMLRQRRDVKLRVEGHTDSDGSAESNLELSEKRAKWVCDYLQDKGVPANRLLWSGYGEERPLFSNATARGKARNRRVELLMISSHSALPAMEGMR